MFLFGFTCQALVICAHFIKTFNPQWISTLTSGQAQAAGACTCTIAPLPPSDISVTSWANVLWACAPQAPKYALHPTLQPWIFQIHPLYGAFVKSFLWSWTSKRGRFQIYLHLCGVTEWHPATGPSQRLCSWASERGRMQGTSERVNSGEQTGEETGWQAFSGGALETQVP